MPDSLRDYEYIFYKGEGSERAIADLKRQYLESTEQQFYKLLFDAGKDSTDVEAFLLS